jgi:hypothetical protein
MLFYSLKEFLLGRTIFISRCNKLDNIVKNLKIDNNKKKMVIIHWKIDSLSSTIINLRYYSPI